MKLKTRLLCIQAVGQSIVVLNNETANMIGVHSSDRVKITYQNKHVIAIVYISSDFPSDYIGLYEEISSKLKIKNEEYVEVLPAEKPEALNHVQAKIRGERLRENEMKVIVKDVIERHLSDIEISSFVTSLYIHGLDMDEIEALSKAMVEYGKNLTFNKSPVLDKHSIGGIPGDKTTILVVPIIAAAGFLIPKTSSRAVTSPAGTADRVETLCPVNLNIQEIYEVLNKTNGCMVWGGTLELAPADDIFIQIEYPLAIDPLLLPSILSKKKAIGATHLIIDIPTGRGAKVKTIGQANRLAYDFIDLGKRLGIDVQCAATYGEQPLGYCIGPALEAYEALSTLMGKSSQDLREKALGLSSILFEMVGIENGRQVAENVLNSGKAEKKLRQIIEAQGGNPKVKPEDLPIGDKTAEITTEIDCRVLWINNNDIAQVAKEAGAPKDKGAGIKLNVKIGDYVEKGGALFKIFAERNSKLESAMELAKKLQPIGLCKKAEEKMIMAKIPPGGPVKRFFEER